MAAALRPVALEGHSPRLAAETKRSIEAAREAERELQRSAEMRRRIEVERRTDLEEPLDLQPSGWRNPFLAADDLPPPPRPPPVLVPTSPTRAPSPSVRHPPPSSPPHRPLPHSRAPPHSRSRPPPSRARPLPPRPYRDVALPSPDFRGAMRMPDHRAASNVVRRGLSNGAERDLLPTSTGALPPTRAPLRSPASLASQQASRSALHALDPESRATALRTRAVALAARRVAREAAAKERAAHADRLYV